MAFVVIVLGGRRKNIEAARDGFNFALQMTQLHEIELFIGQHFSSFPHILSLFLFFFF
jgi:hypothetical protein